MSEVKIERRPIDKEWVLEKTDQEKVEWVLCESDLKIEQKRQRGKVDKIKSEWKDVKKSSWVMPAIGILPGLLGWVTINGSNFLGGLAFFLFVTAVSSFFILLDYNGVKKNLEESEKHGMYLNLIKSRNVTTATERLEHFRPSINNGEPIGVYDEWFTLDNDKFKELLETF